MNRSQGDRTMAHPNRPDESVFEKDTTRYAAKNRRMAEPVREAHRGSPFVSLSVEEWEILKERRPDPSMLGER